jgi:oligopeptide/dipeptide ABC transporter ATP-binding protein
MIFQDPYDALNPGMNVRELLLEPLLAHRKGIPDEEKLQQVAQMLEQMDLLPADHFLNRFPHELSGGQRQRIALARTLMLQPDFVAADEPTSMLDVSVRMEILQLLRSMQEKMGLTMLFITHDLSSAAYVCDQIAVMYRGSIVETGPTDRIISHPQHPYTRALVSVVSDLQHFLKHSSDYILNLDVQQEQEQAETSFGCPFLSRCPRRSELCYKQTPPWKVFESGHQARCFNL